MICISIGNKALTEAINQSLPDLVEIRYDLMQCQPQEVFGSVDVRIKQVATCREGYFSEEDRFELLIKAIEMGSRYVDVEVEAAEKYIHRIKDACKANAADLILSYHDFERTPERNELLELLESLYKKGADVAKIASTSQSRQDNARLLSLYDEPGRKVVFGMGEQGKITRLTSLPLGAEFTFAAISEKEATAPGQPTIDEIRSYLTQINER